MPNYRLVVQTNVSPRAQTRAARSIDRAGIESIDVTATSLTGALLKVGIQFGREKRSPRIVSAEEILAIDFSEITDDDLTRALTQGPVPLDPDDYDGLTFYEQIDFEWTVQKVAETLRESGIMPGLSLSILHDEQGMSDYTMVEIHDTASGSYRSVGRDSRRLMADRSLTGWDGILSIARTLIETVAAEHLL